MTQDPTQKPTAPEGLWALAEKEPPLPAPPDIGVLMQAALAKGAEGAEALERLVSLYERMEDRRAKQEYARAMAAFQADCPTVPHNKTATVRSPRTGGVYSYTYAKIDHLAEFIRPYCRAHGLSYSFDSTEEEGRIHVRCIIRHVGGYSEGHNFSCRVDERAAMSASHQDGSALTVACRRALGLALGITTGAEDTDAANRIPVDDDGLSSGVKTITPEQVIEIQSLLAQFGAEQSQMRDRFLKYMRVRRLQDMPMARYEEAVKAIQLRLNQRETQA